MIFIGTEMFRTQAAARRRASEVLHGHVMFVPLVEPDVDFVTALFWCHPRALEKAGAGVDHFEVRPSPDGRTRNLWVSRIDGSVDNFSIKESVANHAAKETP